MAQIGSQPGLERPCRIHSVGFPKAKGSVANPQYSSGFRLPESSRESFLPQMFAKGCWLLGNWETASPNGCNMLSDHAHNAVAKRQRKARGSLRSRNITSYENRSSFVGSKSASHPKRLAKTFNCRLSGWPLPVSQERTKAVAIPIFAAKWAGV